MKFKRNSFYDYVLVLFQIAETKLEERKIPTDRIDRVQNEEKICGFH